MDDGYTLMIDARTAWLKDNPHKKARDWDYAGVDVQDKYTEQVGGIKHYYIGSGANLWIRKNG